MAAISLKVMIGNCNNNTTKFGSIQYFDILSAILDVIHYPKSQKLLLISLNLIIGTCNKNWTPLSLGHSTTVVWHCINWIPLSLFLLGILNDSHFQKSQEILQFLSLLIFIYLLFKVVQFTTTSHQCVILHFLIYFVLWVVISEEQNWRIPGTLDIPLSAIIYPNGCLNLTLLISKRCTNHGEFSVTGIITV